MSTSSIAMTNERLGDEIAELAAHLDAATHRLLTLIRRFDESGGWADHGALTCAHWLSWRVGLDPGAAREHVRVARVLGTLPAIDGALRAGRVSYSKVRALTRVATAANEETLLAMAISSTASQLERICRGFRLALRTETNDQPEHASERRWVERETETGLVRFQIDLPPEEAATVRRALELAMSRAWKAADVSAETPSSTARRADAFVGLCEAYLSGAAEHTGGPPVEMVVHVEADALADPTSEAGGTLDDGTALARATVDRLACDAAVVQVVEDSRGTVLDVGRRRRTIPTMIRRALRVRDRGCRFPGCANLRVDGHHVVPWSRGGATTLDNLCLLCRRHHRYVHELGFRLERDGHGELRFFRHDGVEVQAACEPARLGPDPIGALRERHREVGIEIDDQTSLPNWDGRPPDYDHIVLCLMAREDVVRASALGS